jgi:hypothetical protein
MDIKVKIFCPAKPLLNPNNKTAFDPEPESGLTRSGKLKKLLTACFRFLNLAGTFLALFEYER